MSSPFEKCTCGHVRGAHQPAGQGACSVNICECTAFTDPPTPERIVVESTTPLTGQEPAYTSGEPVTTSDRTNVVWDDLMRQDAELRLATALAHSTGLPLRHIADSTEGPTYCGIRPYQPIPLLEPTDDLNGYLVIHAGDIKAGDTVQVIQVESGAPRLAPVQKPNTRSPFLQRIYDAIDQGWEDYEFDTDCATDAVQDLLVELLRELDAYYYEPKHGNLADLAGMVEEGRWIK